MQSDSVELTIKEPAAVADANTPERARLLLILDAVRSERMTWRAAASALDVALDAFLQLAKAYGIPVVRYDDADRGDDLSTIAKLERCDIADE